MYWFRTDAGAGPFALIALMGMWTLGGYLLATAGFNLERHERLLGGLALAVTLSVWLSNLLGRWLPPASAFWAANLAVPACGLLAVRFGKIRVKWPRSAGAWGPLAGTLLMAVLFVLMARGVGILDDRKNLSYISIMAAGDIPPHFYMNPEIVPVYHYGFQLFGALLMRLTGLFPWSAFDVAKSLMASVAIGLSGLVGWRLTHRKSGAAFASVLVALASGSRWMLLLVPQGLLHSISARVTLWGSAATSAPNLYDGLASGWAVEGGPPVTIPFAYVNGILQPFVLGSQAGPGAFSLAILMLVLLALPRARGWLSGAILIPVLACWALVSEADFALYAVGLALAFVLSAAWRRLPGWRRQLRLGFVAICLSGMIALVQGGTLTEMWRGLFGAGVGGDAAGELAGFSLRWPPAIVSSHLGELRISDPMLLITGLFELGPALLAAPIAIWMTRRTIRRGRFEFASLGLASTVGLLLPMLTRIETDRDITRLSAFALLGFIVLSLPALAGSLRAKMSGWWRWCSYGWVGSTCLGGMVALSALMTAIPRATLAPDIEPIDAKMADRLWGRLAPGTMVLDSHPWRAVALTGRPTKSSPISSTTLPEWEALVANPDLRSVIQAGYRYMYVDEYWWQRMGGKQGSFLTDPCAVVLALETDDQANGSRRLFDLKDCGES